MPRETDRELYNPGKWFGKPYYFFGDYLLNRYGRRILKLPVNAGLICPNRDGTLGQGGCIFCSDDGSASPAAGVSRDIKTQMQHARISFKRSNSSTRYIAYFQAYTNTYGSAADLRKLYDTALDEEDVLGLMIGTRPDCLSDEVVELIQSYIDSTDELWVELGMQSMHEKSLTWLNRGHSHKDTRKAVNNLRSKKIDVCLHVILGIPGESWKDMMNTAEEIASMDIQGVKFHHLHVISGTPLAKLYHEGHVPLMSMQEYISTLCDFTERLPHTVMLHRLSGDRNEDSLVAPRWGHHKGTIIKNIEEEFQRRGTYQGFLSKINRDKNIITFD